MTQKISGFNTQMGKKINTEQIEQIVKAIIAGKYSWACVLILRFIGYNPIDYIPYRTYIRLLKNNCLVDRQNSDKKEEDLDLKSKLIRL
ncbi:MAG: HetP family heterocyst commitment protein [Goleter apudmare HA4340-LM2]|jgi:hypothetical protein|nr:HetP family heterocyst commitment protein [Goleter apudmare HA4340-LM2]